MLRLPAKLVARHVARGAVVDRGETHEPAEMSRSRLRRQADYGHLEAAADSLGDLAEGDAFLRRGVIARAGGTPFEGEAE